MTICRICILLILISVIGVSVAQNILVLERPGTIKNYKYYLNDHIKLKSISPDTLISGQITAVNDSSIVVDYATEVNISDMTFVYRKRWGFSLLQKLAFIGGGSYLLISTVNGLINNDSPIVPKETLIISGSLIVGGIALMPLTSRRYRTDNEKWRLKILDFTE